jgi:hypothetical protein
MQLRVSSASSRRVLDAVWPCVSFWCHTCNHNLGVARPTICHARGGAVRVGEITRGPAR